MSYFVANQLTIAKDWKTFKCKGGDNNVVPRSNYWTGEIPIEELLSLVAGGGIQFNSFNNKLLTIQHLAFKYKKDWGGCWDKGTDLWHELRKEEKSQKVIEFNKKFIAELKEELKGHTKKNYIVKFSNGYVEKRFKHHVYLTYYKERALKFGKYQAKELVSHYEENETEIIKID